MLSLKVVDVLDRQGNIVEYIHLREQKTKKEKKIKLNQSVKATLKYYFKKATITNPEQYLFTSYRSNQRIDRIRLWKMVKKWGNEVGLKTDNLGTHTLRYT
jgi:site-specific recombinase XerD